MPFSTDDPNAQELLARNASFDAPNRDNLSMPAGFPPQVNPMPPAQQQTQQPGGVRKFFASMLSGMADAAMKESTGMNSMERAVAQQDIQFKAAQTRLAQSSAQMVDTPLGPMSQAAWMKIAPAYLGGQSRIGAAQINKRFLTTPNGLYDTQTKDVSGFPTLIPGSSAGIKVTPEIAQEYGLPQDFVGKPMKITDLAAAERGQAIGTQAMQTGAGPVIVPKTGPNAGKATQVTLNGKAIPSNQESGAYWQARYGVVKTVDGDGNPYYVSRLNAPGQAAPESSFQILKGKAGLENYKNALGRIQENMPILGDDSQRALVAQTLKQIGSTHDPGIIASFLGNAVSSGLDPKAADLVAATLSAREWVAANKSFAGNMVGSEALYGRMASTIPSPANSLELNKRLIQQDIANTTNVEKRIAAFQGGRNPAGNKDQNGNTPPAGAKIRDFSNLFK